MVGKPFPNLETYLDIHFRLLSEDFMHPTRQGLMKMLAGQNAGGVRTYGNVTFQPRCGLVYNQFLVPERPSSWRLYHIKFKAPPRVDWSLSRRLIHGSLVFLWDGASELLVATVVDGFYLNCPLGHPWTDLPGGNMTIALESSKHLTANTLKKVFSLIAITCLSLPKINF